MLLYNNNEVYMVNQFDGVSQIGQYCQHLLLGRETFIETNGCTLNRV